MISVSRATQPTPVDELSQTATGVLCLVPREIPADVVAALDQHFASTGVSVKVTQGRRRERRGGGDRRYDTAPSAAAIERRFAPELEGRRFWERRSEYKRIEAPILPEAALPYAEQLRFVRLLPRTVGEGELNTMRSMLETWRDRARAQERETGTLFRVLVGLVEDLRRLRTMSPRWFLALHRGERTIDAYRDRHLSR
jgi:hypothetical protein